MSWVQIRKLNPTWVVTIRKNKGKGKTFRRISWALGDAFFFDRYLSFMFWTKNNNNSLPAKDVLAGSVK